MKRSTFLRGALAAVFTLALAAVSPAWAQAPFDPPGLDNAIAAKAFHVDGLLANPGVVGVGVGLTPGGQAAVVIMTESAGVGGLPRSLDGVPVVIKVTGAFYAIDRPVDGFHNHNAKPTASFTYECTDTDRTCIFDGSESADADGTIASYGWVFDDGSGDAGTPVEHTYVEDGTYTVTLTVTDDDGGTDSISQDVSFGVPAASADPCDSDPTVECTRPVHIGVSTGNEGSCSAGTIGARVKNGTTVYALSNNHVYALSNNAVIGNPTSDDTSSDTILQPGRYDTNCATDSADAIGMLFDFVPIEFSTSASNTVDAAIALSSTAVLDNSTPSDGYGTPSSTIVAEQIGQTVQKYGRTTGLTKATVTMIDVTLNIGYSSGTARFVEQIIVEGSSGLMKNGDSGSLLVTDNDDSCTAPLNNCPVGLLFAANRSGRLAVANPIDLVLDALGVSIDGGS